MPQVEVPPAVLVDEPATLRVSGVAPAVPVRIRVTLRDTAGRDWEARTTVRADGRGVATLQPGPVDPPGLQGLVQALTPPSGADRVAFDDETDLEVRVDDGTETATVSLTRQIVAPEVTVTDPGPGLSGRGFAPQTAERTPAVLAIRGRMDRPWTTVGGALSARGYHVLAPARPGSDASSRESTEPVSLAVLERAVDRLRERSGADRVGLIAHGLGTQAAILLAAQRRDIGALVCYSPAAFVTADPAHGGPVWGDAEGPLARLDPSRADEPRAGFEAAVANADPAHLEAARLPVEAVEAPLFLISGSEDAVWPAGEWATRLQERVATESEPPANRYEVYPDAGHDLAIPFRPTTVRQTPAGIPFGGGAAETAHAEAASWPEVRSFLAQALDVDS